MVDQGFPPSFVGSLAHCQVLACYVRLLGSRKEEKPEKWQEFQNIIWESEAHIHRRLMDRKWSRGEVDRGQVLDPSWNNNETINVYNVWKAGGIDSTQPTPEAYRARIVETQLAIKRLETEIAKAGGQPESPCRNFEVTWIQRNLIYKQSGKRPPYSDSAGAAHVGHVVLTVREARMSVRLLEANLLQLETESERKWGLCRDWGASLQQHLIKTLAPKHFTICREEFDKRIVGMVFQHTVNPIVEIEPTIFSCKFCFIIDAWKNPTQFWELNHWMSETGYHRYLI